MSGLEAYASIEKWLKPWIDQLSIHPYEESAYRVLLDEALDLEKHGRELLMLDEGLATAARVCANFPQLLSEKRDLPPDLDEANVTVLNKLSEVRAITGLVRLGMTELSFIESPDLSGALNGQKTVVEVTRLGRSEGARSKVWEKHMGSLEADGFEAGSVERGGNVETALAEAIYREVEDKFRQIRKGEAATRILWISAGRDYFLTGKYALPALGAWRNMTNTLNDCLRSAIGDLKSAEVCRPLNFIVLCSGQDHVDTLIPVWPAG